MNSDGNPFLFSENAFSNYTSNELIYGGITRLESVKKAVNKIKADNYDYIVIFCYKPS